MTDKNNHSAGTQRETSTLIDPRPPGEKLAELIHERGISHVELANKMRVSVKGLLDVIRARTRLRESLAVRIEEVTGQSARDFLIMELDYRLELARKHLQKQSGRPRQFPSGQARLSRGDVARKLNM